jgi:putative SOS response-associated peptidase YedK
MPGRLILTTPVNDVARTLGVPDMTLPATPARYNMQPGQDLLTLTDTGLGLMRWGMIPVGRVNARGRPVMETIINARSETLFDKSAYGGVRRAVVPVDGWYEWTGKTRRKTAWRITSRIDELLFFAAIWDSWRAPNGVTVNQVATVTCEPNADVRDIHHRMGVLLRRDDIPLWMSGTPDGVSHLLQPWPNAKLQVEIAADVDWSGP